jgi:hypothetical protein
MGGTTGGITGGATVGTTGGATVGTTGAVTGGTTGGTTGATTGGTTGGTAGGTTGGTTGATTGGATGATTGGTTGATTGTTGGTTGTPGQASTTSTTTEQVRQFQNTLDIDLNDIAALGSQADLEAQLVSGAKNAAGNGSNATVEIHYLKVISRFGGFSQTVMTQEIHDDIIYSFSSLTGVDISDITADNVSHSNAGVRRLLDTEPDVVVVDARVHNTGSNDVVKAASDVAGNVSSSGLSTALKARNPQTFSNVSLSLPQAPKTSMSAMIRVFSPASQAPTAAAVQTHVGNSITGGASVTVINVVEVTTTTITPMGTTVTKKFVIDDRETDTEANKCTRVSNAFASFMLVASVAIMW